VNRHERRQISKQRAGLSALICERDISGTNAAGFFPKRQRHGASVNVSIASAVLAVAIRPCKPQRIEHMPRHHEAKKSGREDCKDHDCDDLLHDAKPHALKLRPLTRHTGEPERIQHRTKTRSN
jgi:hypothetical protein